MPGLDLICTTACTGKCNSRSCEPAHPNAAITGQGQQRCHDKTINTGWTSLRGTGSVCLGCELTQKCMQAFLHLNQSCELVKGKQPPFPSSISIPAQPALPQQPTTSPALQTPATGNRQLRDSRCAALPLGAPLGHGTQTMPPTAIFESQRWGVRLSGSKK